MNKITTKNNHTFFGYYNKSPWNSAQNKILFCESSFINKQPTKNDILKIGYLDINSNKKTYLTKTNAWNWQQGCMLQWHPTDKDIIIFNKKQKSRFVSIFFNIKTKKETIIPHPIYDIAKNGELAISLNFPRLNNLRKGYGYEGLKDEFEKTKIPDEDGVFIINLKNKTKKLLISLKDLYSHKTLDSMNFGFHWVNHAEFSPDSKKIFFFHRWQVPNKMHYTRLFVYEINTKKLKLMPDSGLYSHMCWKNNNEIFGYAMKPGRIGNIRKSQSISKIVFNLLLPTYRKLVPKNIRKSVLPVGYFLFNIKNNSTREVPAYPEDGHPSFSPDERFILTDTYPDKNHYRTLILYDTKLDKRHIVGKFCSMPDKKYTNDPKWDSSGMRCDLHPRWDRKGEKVCIDSVHEGHRGMYIIDVSKITKN